MSPYLVLELPFAIYLVLVAFFVGSFINLAADRLPRGESLVTPRSHCRSCGRVLNLVDLLPVGGYFIRGGRCATCRTPIGLSAPLVEAAAGLLMLIPIVVLGLWPGSLMGVCLVIVLFLVALVVSHVRYGVTTATGR
ncbi:MAG TPA: prepilin peptidase [Acidimicrobiales bacterium]|nr:prepilin peptidase [Acidimicrobiales bacterium]